MHLGERFLLLVSINSARAAATAAEVSHGKHSMYMESTEPAGQ